MNRLTMLAAASGVVLSANCAMANCYILRNNASHPVTFSFAYNTPMMPPFDTGVTLLTGAQYPIGGGQWCINVAGLRATITLNGGKPSWKGALIFGGAGNDIAPSGTYSVGN
jgi:hypothetical protein